MKAIIVTGGKQYTVAEGDILFVEKLGVEAEETVKFEQVLAVLDGENTKIGTPVVEGAAVSAAVAMAECTINDVCGARAKVRVKDESARITLTLPASCDEEESVLAVLAGLLIYLCSLRDEYPDHIEVLEV